MPSNYGSSRMSSRRRRRRRQVMINRAIFVVVLLALLGGIIFGAVKLFGGDSEEESKAAFETTGGSGESGEETGDDPSGESQPEETTADSAEKIRIMEEAAYIAAGYDYDGAVELLQTIPGYENDTEGTAAIDEYLAIKATCVQVDPTKVPHIFYHSLVNEPDRAFDFDRIDITTASNLGTFNDSIEVEPFSNKMVIGFNYKYMLAALNACDDEEIMIELQSTLAPIILKPMEKDDYLFLVLPLRMKE